MSLRTDINAQTNGPIDISITELLLYIAKGLASFADPTLRTQLDNSTGRFRLSDQDLLVYIAKACTSLGSSPSSAQTQVVSTVAATVTIPSGAVILTYGGVSTVTLPAPTVDGSTLEIFDASGHAHSVDAGANNLNGNAEFVTFSGTPGAAVRLVAYNGIWYTTDISDTLIS